jgi:hypothetical protein
LIDEKRRTSPTSSTQVSAVTGPTAGMVMSRSTRPTRSGSRPSDRSKALSVFPRRTALSRHIRSRTARRPAPLPFRRVLRSARTLGIGLAHCAGPGEDFPAGSDSGRSLFPPFLPRQSPGKHFPAAVSVAPPGHVSGIVCWCRAHPASRVHSLVARGTRTATTFFPSPSSTAPTGRMTSVGGAQSAEIRFPHTLSPSTRDSPNIPEARIAFSRWSSQQPGTRPDGRTTQSGL